MYKYGLMYITIILLLTACGGGTSDKMRHMFAGGVYKIGKPYQIEGQWYYPKKYRKYNRVGVASWYGSEFQGRRTANGEIFDMNLLTAAHPTLPLPVMARVTNLKNGRSIIVRVNDRGPFKRNREIDLSRRAAEILRYKTQGTTKVRVKYLGRAPLYNSRGKLIYGKEAHEPIMDKAVIASNQRYISTKHIVTKQVEMRHLDGTIRRKKQNVFINKPHYVQVGVFSQESTAYNLVKKLENIENIQVDRIDKGGQYLFRVRLGPLESRITANKIIDTVLDYGHQEAIIVK